MSEASPAPDADAPEIEFANTVDDLRVLGRYGWRWWSPLAIVGATLLCCLPGGFYLVWCGYDVVAGVVAVGFVGLALWLLYRSWTALPKQHPKFLVRRRVTLTPEEFRQRTGETSGSWRWCYLREVVDYDGSLLIGIDHGWWVIPPSAFASPTERTRFCEEVVARQREASPPAAGEPLPADEHVRYGMQVEFQNSPALHRAAASKGRGGRPDEWQAWIGLVVILVSCSLAMNHYRPVDAIGWLSATLFHVTANLWVLLMSTRGAAWFASRRSNWRLHLPERVVITPTGVRSTTPVFDTFVQWDRFDAVEEDARAIYIIYVKASGQMTTIPKSAFANEAEAGRFFAMAREYFERSQAEHAHRTQSGGSQPVLSNAQTTTPTETGNPYQAPGASS